MPEANVDDFLIVAQEAAKQSGKILQKHWGKLHDIRNKACVGDLVTEADKESDEAITSLIKKHFPTHKILSEELGPYEPSKGSQYKWVIDPLDGTTNYTHQYPMAAVSIGLLESGIPILGVVYNPFHNELFLAAAGRGATLNGKAIHVSHVDILENSLLATGFAYDRRETSDNNYKEFCHITNLSQGVRRGGAASLDMAYVAAGRLDGYWERGIQPWDIVAGIVLIIEAGGQVSEYDMSPLDISSGRILATNGLLHKALSSELEKAKSI